MSYIAPLKRRFGKRLLRERCTFNWLDNYEVKTFCKTWKFFLAGVSGLKILVGSNSKKERINVVSEKRLSSLLFGQNFSRFRLLAFFFFMFSFLSFLRTCLRGGGGPQIGEVTCGGSPDLSCKRDQIKMRGHMDRRVTQPQRVIIISPTWGPPPPRKLALSTYLSILKNLFTRIALCRAALKYGIRNPETESRNP